MSREVTARKHIAWAPHGKRTRCPECGARRGWAAAVEIDGQPAPEGSGYCHACGHTSLSGGATGYNRYTPVRRAAATVSTEISADILDSTRGEQSPLHTYLREIGGDALAAHLRQWNVGTDSDGRTVWHYIDRKGRHVSAKGMIYGPNGKRNKDVPARFGVKIGGRYLALTRDNGYQTCLYGEHLLAEGAGMIDYRTNTAKRYDRSTPVFVVESEKSAVLGSFLFPDYVWIATGGTSGITESKAEALSRRRVVILMDTDAAGIKAAERTAERLRDAGAMVIERIGGKPVQIAVFGTTVPEGYDIADHAVTVLTGGADNAVPDECTEEYEREAIRWAAESAADDMTGRVAV